MKVCAFTTKSAYVPQSRRKRTGAPDKTWPKCVPRNVLLDQKFNTECTDCGTSHGHASKWDKMSRAELFHLIEEQMGIALNAHDTMTKEHTISFVTELLEARYVDVLPCLKPNFIRFICCALRPNLENQSFVYTVCRFITVLGKNSADHCIFMSQNIDVILGEDLLRYNFEGSQYIHKTIIETFTVLLNASEPHRAALLEPTSRGIEWAFAYLRRWNICEEMQLTLLEYFRTLLEDEEEIKLEIVKRGLLVDLSYALECFPSSYKIKYLAIELLITLTEKSGEIRKQSVEEGHLKHILRNLQLLRGTPEMVRLVMQAIENFSSDLDTKNIMGKVGFVSELMQTLRKMIEPVGDIYSKPQREALCRVIVTLRGVVYGSKINRYLLMDATHIKTIKEIVMKYKFDENIVEAALRVLEALVSDLYHGEKIKPQFLLETSKREVLEDIIRFTTSILSANKGKSRCAELACSVLYQICLMGHHDAVFETCPELHRLVPEAIQACFENEVVLNIALSLSRYTNNNSGDSFSHIFRNHRNKHVFL